MTVVTMEQVVGANLTRYREREGISQAELGRRIGNGSGREWSRQAVSLAESGKRTFGVADLLTISLGVGLTLADLLTVPDGADVVLQDAVIAREDVHSSLCVNATTSADIERWKRAGRRDAYAAMSEYLSRQIPGDARL